MSDSNDLDVNSRKVPPTVGNALHLSRYEKALFQVLESRACLPPATTLICGFFELLEALQLLSILLQFSLDIDNYSDIHDTISLLQLVRPDYVAVTQGQAQASVVAYLLLCASFLLVFAGLFLGNLTQRWTASARLRETLKSSFKLFLQGTELCFWTLASSRVQLLFSHE